MKLLFYGESALNPTGFGAVNSHLLRACSQVADQTIHVATTHYHETYDREQYPWEIRGCPFVPIEERTVEHQRNLPTIQAALEEDWDIFFYQGDMGWNNDVLALVRDLQKKYPERQSIFYMPIDGDFSLAGAFGVFTWCTVPVVYTNHAKSIVVKYCPEIAENLSVMWLGTEPDVFYPLSPEEKRAARLKFFGEAYSDRFIALNVNRNQPRKDLMRCMAIWHEFHTSHPDSTLMLHSVIQDVGGNLTFQAQLVGCDIWKQPAEIAFSDLDLARPWTRETLNELYNACDVLVSTAYGEGWGLTTTEAMSAGTPVIVPANTANLDILGEQLSNNYYERGWGARVGKDLDHTVFIYQNGSSMTNIVYAADMLNCLNQVYTNKGQAQYKGRVARQWASENSWKVREEQWIQLLQLMKK